MDDFELTPAGKTDAPSIARIERACFSVPLLEEQILSQIADEKYDILCAQNRQGEIVAYAGMYHVLDEGYITNVAVQPEARRQHIADALLENLERIAAAKELSFLTLEVRESNAPAISLYKKHGYEKAGSRKDYYRSPKENALIMTKKLSEERN